VQDNEFFVKVARFRYLGTPVVNQNYIHEEVKSRLILGNLATV
jgi:hypothetical protein